MSVIAPELALLPLPLPLLLPLPLPPALELDEQAVNASKAATEAAELSARARRRDDFVMGLAFRIDSMIG
ncbi:MAG TPA: hypothetical protein VK823_05935 [Streptosporangiaceae bacterium]|nr:hypothetical protein [Streptosporangiaceae bacterium]